MWYAIEGHDGSDVLGKRLQARAAHLARLHALRDAGRLLLAGPCPAIDAEDPGPAGFSGSILKRSWRRCSVVLRVSSPMPPAIATSPPGIRSPT